MQKKILITNDDGIEADGLKRLVYAAKEFGEVWVVAPDGQRSAASHTITLHKPINISPVSYPIEGVKAFQCSGMPADCIRVGVLAVMPEKPDVVLSGINKGYNIASDIQYSATAGAAFEAVFQGINGIALSEGLGGCVEVSEAYISEVLEKLIAQQADAGCIWNVNFPDCTSAECRGILWNCKVSRGMVYRDTYDVVEEAPDGGKKLMVHGHYNEEAEAGTDFHAVVKKYVSIGQVNNIGW